MIDAEDFLRKRHRLIMFDVFMDDITITEAAETMREYAKLAIIEDQEQRKAMHKLPKEQL